MGGYNNYIYKFLILSGGEESYKISSPLSLLDGKLENLFFIISDGEWITQSLLIWQERVTQLSFSLIGRGDTTIFKYKLDLHHLEVLICLAYCEYVWTVLDLGAAGEGGGGVGYNKS